MRLYGIRHHGPGSARSLLAALEANPPSLLLMEGPPEGQDLIHLLGHEEMVPPVALLLYDTDNPQHAVHYPLAVHSPEYVAACWALKNDVPIRFCDAAYANRPLPTEEDDKDCENLEEAELAAHVREDPLGEIARLAGYEDAERWWEDTFESGGTNPEEAFELVAETMKALRDHHPDPTGWEAVREASMRTHLRAALKETPDVAVVVGAWHVPALLADVPVKDDKETLKGLPRRKVSATWVPWTENRLSQRSGYGAGVESPGWYAHLWANENDVVERWVVRLAHLLRREDIPASTASVIETVNLANMLGTLRGRRLPNLSDVTEACQAILTGGDAVPLLLVLDELVLGTLMGSVPSSVPTVPLLADLEKHRKTLRLPQPTSDKEVIFDLREETGLRRSHLLHRLSVLEVPWGRLGYVSGTGTFKEAWTLKWEPEVVVRLVEESRYGSTVESAATRKILERSALTRTLAESSHLVEIALIADLEGALPGVLLDLDAHAAGTRDLPPLLDALPSLANTLRYGSVRTRETSQVRGVYDTLVDRTTVGLTAGCRTLDEDTSRKMLPLVQRATDSVNLVGSERQVEAWDTALEGVTRTGSPLLAGWAARRLLDGGALSAAEVNVLMHRSVATSPAKDAALWAEGLLQGSGLLLVQDDQLFELVDEWVKGLTEEEFDDVLPLLRRTFSTFSSAERRQVGQRVNGGTQDDTGDIVWDRAVLALPAVVEILGGSK